MKCLALTSSTTQASIALGDESQMFERSHRVPRGHVEFMNSALEILLQESGWKLSELDVIAVDPGPGSFTGIRVSISIARSLCYTLGKPFYAESSLSLLRAAPSLQKKSSTVVSGINAFKNLIFCSVARKDDQSKGSPLVLSPKQVEVWLGQLESTASFTFVGDAWDIYKQDFSPEFIQKMQRPSEPLDHPNASVLVQHALLRPDSWSEDWKSMVPLYLRESAAEENLRKV